MTPEVALQILVSLLSRAPCNPAEAFAANAAASVLEKLIKDGKNQGQ